MMPTDAFISCRDANGWRDGSWVILNKVYKGGRPQESFILQREAMGGYARHGRLPPRLSIFYFSVRKV